MKRILFTLLFCSFSPFLHSQCSISEIVSRNKTSFDKSFGLDGFSYFKFEFKDKKQSVQKEFIALKGKKYQLLFCGSGFAEMVSIQVYDDDGILLGGTSIGNDRDNNSFYPSKGGSLKIVYEIPPSELGVDHEECLALLIGSADK